MKRENSQVKKCSSPPLPPPPAALPPNRVRRLPQIPPLTPPTPAPAPGEKQKNASTPDFGLLGFLFGEYGCLIDFITVEEKGKGERGMGLVG